MTDRQIKLLRVVLPVAIVAFAAFVAVAMVRLKADVPTRPPEINPLLFGWPMFDSKIGVSPSRVRAP